jgi:putative nucleotidyltransferase with HDIG domain
MVSEKTEKPWRMPGTPGAPDFTIDWPHVLATVPGLQPLATCAQDPRYHAEGDVWTHTKLVCEALVGLAGWRSLPADEQGILFGAALLHDIAKPAATVVNPDGTISSKGHVKLGVRMARLVLAELGAPFATREAIVGVIQEGSLPLWLWDKADPLWSVLRASWVTRCDWLALMAEADVRGRICGDQQKLFDAIGLFGDFAQEQGCFDRPWPFASDLSRFVYFHQAQRCDVQGQVFRRDPAHVVFDDWRGEVTLLSGLPGSGKDFWIQRWGGDRPVISLDQIRLELGVDPRDTQGPVIQRAKELAKVYLRKGEPFIWNATNLTQQIRSQLVDLFADYKARVHLVYREVPWDLRQRQNLGRKAMVPEAVVRRMRDRLEVPDRTEAHRVDWVVDS